MIEASKLQEWIKEGQETDGMKYLLIFQKISDNSFFPVYYEEEDEHEEIVCYQDNCQPILDIKL